MKYYYFHEEKGSKNTELKSFYLELQNIHFIKIN